MRGEIDWQNAFLAESDESNNDYSWSGCFEEDDEQEEIFTGQLLINKIEEIFLTDKKKQNERTNILETQTRWSTESRQAQQHKKAAGADYQIDALF